MDELVVGKIVKTVGLKGEVKIYPSSSFRDVRFKVGRHVFYYENNEIHDLTIKHHTSRGEMDLVIFNEISSIEQAKKLVDKQLFVKKDSSILKKGEYFFTDLIGLNVSFDNGTFIGKVIKVEEYTSYATLRVARENNKDVLIPFVKSFIKEVSLEKQSIIINFIEGLL